jgi:hypothetical protein
MEYFAHAYIAVEMDCSRRRKEADFHAVQRNPPPYVGGYN